MLEISLPEETGFQRGPLQHSSLTEDKRKIGERKKGRLRMEENKAGRKERGGRKRKKGVGEGREKGRRSEQRREEGSEGRKEVNSNY